jgi:hypothetical protein
MSFNNLGTIQVDLDGLWTNLKYYGYDHDVEDDMIFETSIPRFLDLFDKYNVKATFFLIGKDCEVSEKKKLIVDIHRAGHEIANHTYSHVFGFKNLSILEKTKEIEMCEKLICNITGKMPSGFKAPGYDQDLTGLKLLNKKNYLYDSSIIPTSIYPMIMNVNRLISGGVKRNHGPGWNWMFAPNTIYNPSYNNKLKKGSMNLFELPCSVTPFFKLPFHATFALKFGFDYFKYSFKLAKFANIPINYEFHAADLCNNVKDKRLAHLNSPSFEKKYSVCKKMLKHMTKSHKFVTSQNLINSYKNKFKSRAY